MKTLTKTLALAPLLALALAACAANYGKPGYYTEVKDGRLWVFEEGSKDLEQFKKTGEPAKQYTKIGAGPDGMTIKSSDAKVIDAYMAAK
ncbi:MAG: hypothetical protein HQL45_03570 [Alphaproteobacteria bacterium]|nr:hypothetical protein [Alphaproteobacteria bacterium]